MDVARERSGRTLVVAIAGLLVGLAGLLGYAVGTAVPIKRSPTPLGLVALPPTPAGLAVHGAVTIAALLAAGILALAAISRLAARRGG